MDMEFDNIYSENPEQDLWQELLRYSYETNIKQYFKEHDLNGNLDTIDCIIGSFLQAHEYYRMTCNANLQISPLLLYYGTTNLLYGMTNLISGNTNKIENHGMSIIIPNDMNFIADTGIKFFSPEKGGVHVFARSMGYSFKLFNSGEWILKEFLDSLAEINDDYKRCYSVACGKIVMLDVLNTPDEKVERISYSEDHIEDFTKLLDCIDGFKESYLPVSKTIDIKTGEKYFTLRHKISSKNISEHSYSGQPYLRAGHEKNGKLITLPTIFNMYIALYLLATLCRYFPERWSPFVLKDNTGEKLLIEKFLYYSRRIIPNIVLNHILGKEVQYVSTKYQERDTTKYIGEHQLQEMVDSEIEKKIESEKYLKMNSQRK